MPRLSDSELKGMQAWDMLDGIALICMSCRVMQLQVCELHMLRNVARQEHKH